MRIAPFAALLALLLRGAPVRAEPEWNIAAQSQLCGLGAAGRVWQRTAFCGSLRGDLLMASGRNREAETELEQALTVARNQEARFWELRAATSLARLCVRALRDSRYGEIFGSAPRSGLEPAIADVLG